MKIHHLLVMTLVVSTLTACSRTAPVLNIQHPIQAQYSNDQVRKAIIEAGLARKWVMTPVAPGVINGHLYQRGHSADIRIDYTATSYKISYIGSQNLLASGGKIHRNYNRWVNNLDEDIKLRLSAQALN